MSRKKSKRTTHIIDDVKIRDPYAKEVTKKRAGVMKDRRKANSWEDELEDYLSSIEDYDGFMDGLE